MKNHIKSQPPEGHKEPHRQAAHAWYEDAIAIGIGTLMCSFSVALLTKLGLITGQTAGLGVLLSYVTDWEFGTIFFILNIPFYLLAWFRLGLIFTLKTFLAVAVVTAQMHFMPAMVQFETLNPWFGAILSGSLAGAGLLILFRHGTSLGGIGVLGLYIQERTGFQAGWFQLSVDAVIFTIALFVLNLPLVAFSLLGALITNMAIGMNHRKDRYIAR
ncbi:YitT family protein [Halocynthiibacter styelae]|uniref:YitT family protein n=1 Tax=Halocynthiibacter styelae TaxID=2761955 RepID=A0A8J7ITZ4_9RHOB|nr:YitT family protein [Paenihalocynthiibacter styelae]MBI1492288.1 YitT family protein [Paenihalocynthiibacter styelae]